MGAVWFAPDSGVVGRASIPGEDDDGLPGEVAGMLEQFDEARIDVDLATTTTSEFPLVEMFRDVAHAYNVNPALRAIFQSTPRRGETTLEERPSDALTVGNSS